MIEPQHFPGEWCDVASHPDGDAFVALEQPGVAVARVNGREVWRQAVGWGLGLTITARPDGSVVCAHQGHQTGLLLIFNGATIRAAGPVFGQNGVEFMPDGRLLVMRSPSDYEVLTLDRALQVTAREAHQVPFGTTSQGFLDSPELPFADLGRFAVPGLVLPNIAGELSIGQATTDPPHLSVSYRGQLATVYDGLAFEPHIIEARGRWVAAARTPKGALRLELAPPFPAVVPPVQPPPPVPVPTSVPTPAPTPMQLPDSVKTTRDRYVGHFPVPQGAMGEAFEEEARQWTIKLAQQVAFEHPGQGWGVKSGDPGRPISKDTIARKLDGRLYIWDLLTGTGTGRPRLVADPQSEDVTGQFFHDEIQAKDYLGVQLPPPVPVPVPTPVPVPAPAPAADLEPVLAAIRGIAALVTVLGETQIAHGQELRDLRARVEALATHQDEVIVAQADKVIAAIPVAIRNTRAKLY